MARRKREPIACVLAATVTVKDSSVESAILLTQLFYGGFAISYCSLSRSASLI